MYSTLHSWLVLVASRRRSIDALELLGQKSGGMLAALGLFIKPVSPSTKQILLRDLPPNKLSNDSNHVPSYLTSKVSTVCLLSTCDPLAIHFLLATAAFVPFDFVLFCKSRPKLLCRLSITVQVLWEIVIYWQYMYSRRAHAVLPISNASVFPLSSTHRVDGRSL